jgi:hypothetical protein
MCDPLSNTGVGGEWQVALGLDELEGRRWSTQIHVFWASPVRFRPSKEPPRAQPCPPRKSRSPLRAQLLKNHARHALEVESLRSLSVSGLRVYRTTSFCILSELNSSFWRKSAIDRAAEPLKCGHCDLNHHRHSLEHWLGPSYIEEWTSIHSVRL